MKTTVLVFLQWNFFNRVCKSDVYQNNVPAMSNSDIF